MIIVRNIYICFVYIILGFVVEKVALDTYFECARLAIVLGGLAGLLLSLSFNLLELRLTRYAHYP